MVAVPYNILDVNLPPPVYMSVVDCSSKSYFAFFHVYRLVFAAGISQIIVPESSLTISNLYREESKFYVVNVLVSPTLVVQVNRAHQPLISIGLLLVSLYTRVSLKEDPCSILKSYRLAAIACSLYSSLFT